MFTAIAHKHANHVMYFELQKFIHAKSYLDK